MSLLQANSTIINLKFQLNDLICVKKEWRLFAWGIELQSYSLGLNISPDIAKQRAMLQECYNHGYVLPMIEDSAIDEQEYDILENGDIVDDKELRALEQAFYDAYDQVQSEPESGNDSVSVEDVDVDIHAVDFAQL